MPDGMVVGQIVVGWRERKVLGTVWRRGGGVAEARRRQGDGVVWRVGVFGGRSNKKRLWKHPECGQSG